MILPLFELKIEIYNLNSIGNMFLSISLFLLFNKIKIKSKFINKIASTTFGIYLIHEHPVFKSLLWGVVSDFISSYVSNIALIYVFAVLLVFLFCMLIDLVRQMTIHKLVLKMESRLLKNKNLA